MSAKLQFLAAVFFCRSAKSPEENVLRGAKVGRSVSVEEDGNRLEELNFHWTKPCITLQLTGSAKYMKEVQAELIFKIF